MPHRPFSSISRPLRLATMLGGSAMLLLTSGCPKSPPTCPNCDIKFTIQNYQELNSGYSIANVTLEAEVESSESCPSNQSSCTMTESMPQNSPGTYDPVKSPFSLADKDQVKFNLKVRLVNGGKDITKQEPVEQYKE